MHQFKCNFVDLAHECAFFVYSVKHTLKCIPQNGDDLYLALRQNYSHLGPPPIIAKTTQFLEIEVKLLCARQQEKPCLKYKQNFSKVSR